MDRYVTGTVIRALREGKKMTQEELAEKIHVGGKAVEVLGGTGHGAVVDGDDQPGAEPVRQGGGLRRVHGVGAADGQKGRVAAHRGGFGGGVGVARHIEAQALGL